MLNHTKKVKEIYEDIQRKLFYMIPEKWDRNYDKNLESQKEEIFGQISQCQYRI